MNPIIVIPTYWTANPWEPGVYDHATAIDAPMPELARCLDTLDEVRGVIRTAVLLVASPEDEAAARARVNTIVREHPGLNPVVIGSDEARVISGQVERLAPGLDGEIISLRGYGAIRNMGLAVAAVYGHDVVVFLDDDEVALSPDFLIDAVYGLGKVTRQDIPVLAKTGHFIDANDSHYADEANSEPWERWWTKRREFNAWMSSALSGTRICRSNYVCGGCLAIHANAYSQVAFDPYITRGEDLDYLFNLRLLGMEMWFDGNWYVKHLPPVTPDEPNRFLQDVYRWTYERSKLGFASQREDLRQVTPASLMPYPGAWLSPEVEKRILYTTLARVVFGPYRLANLRILLQGRRDAKAYAERNASSYVRLLSFWSRVINGLWDNAELVSELEACAPNLWPEGREAAIDAEWSEPEGEQEGAADEDAASEGVAAENVGTEGSPKDAVAEDAATEDSQNASEDESEPDGSEPDGGASNGAASGSGSPEEASEDPSSDANADVAVEAASEGRGEQVAAPEGEGVSDGETEDAGAPDEQTLDAKAEDESAGRANDADEADGPAGAAGEAPSAEKAGAEKLGEGGATAAAVGAAAVAPAPAFAKAAPVSAAPTAPASAPAPAAPAATAPVSVSPTPAPVPASEPRVATVPLAPAVSVDPDATVAIPVKNMFAAVRDASGAVSADVAASGANRATPASGTQAPLWPTEEDGE